MLSIKYSKREVFLLIHSCRVLCNKSRVLTVSNCTRSITWKYKISGKMSQGNQLKQKGFTKKANDFETSTVYRCQQTASTVKRTQKTEDMVCQDISLPASPHCSPTRNRETTGMLYSHGYYQDRFIQSIKVVKYFSGIIIKLNKSGFKAFSR